MRDIIDYMRTQNELCLEQSGFEMDLDDWIGFFECEEFQDLFPGVTMDMFLRWILKEVR